jgi:hypothetical protein
LYVVNPTAPTTLEFVHGVSAAFFIINKIERKLNIERRELTVNIKILASLMLIFRSVSLRNEYWYRISIYFLGGKQLKALYGVNEVSLTPLT